MARIVSVTNWTLEDIMHNMTMSQLVLTFDRFPNPSAEPTQPLDETAPRATDAMLRNMGGVFVNKE